MCPTVFVSSPSQFSAVSALVEKSGKDTDVVVFTPQFISLLLINAYWRITADNTDWSGLPGTQ